MLATIAGKSSRHFLKQLSSATTAIACKHTLPELPYDYKALEPIISEEIMTLHHTKHHQTYVNNLNAAEEQLAQAQADCKYDVISDQSQLRNFLLE